MSIRPYQQTAIDAALAALDKSGSAIMQMPTGAGKTKSATEVVRTSDGPVWFVCHRQEIERQVARAFTEAGIEFGIVSPRGAPEYDKRVQIVSVRTLRRRIADLPPPALVVWDECHHVAAKTWAALREQLSEAKHLGLTATPERLDGKGLREWFDDLIVGPSIEQLIADGWLSPARYFAPSDPDLTAAKLQAGDYAKKDADAVMNTTVLIGDAVAEYKRNAAGKRALAFCTSVAASEALVERFNADGIPAQHVDGNTPDDARSAAVAALVDGRVKVLSNVEVFTEGFDVPGIDAVILMRPTKSPTLFLQMIGRALRVAPGKAEAIIVDHAGLHRDHGWFADNWHWELDGGAAKARRRAVERGPRKCPECHEVRADRVPVCACGYEFPTGREIGEFDGVLTEVRGVVPEGCETQAEFARRLGFVPVTVCSWVKAGMPNIKGYPITGAADNWAKDRARPSPPPGCETREGFTRRMGASSGAAVEWARRGMPMVGEFVPVLEASEWVYENARSIAPAGHVRATRVAKIFGLSSSSPRNWRRRGMPGIGPHIQIKGMARWIRDNVKWLQPSDPNLVSYQKFSEICGYGSSSTVAEYAKKGLPIKRVAARKLVVLDEALLWVEENVARRKPGDNENVRINTFAKLIGRSAPFVEGAIRDGMPINDGLININEARKWLDAKQLLCPDGYLTRADFERRVGARPEACGLLIKRGLPMYGNYVNLAEGLAWYDHWSKYKRPLGYLPASDFAKSINAKPGTVWYWKKNCDLPYDPKLGIPIQAGLEWVRDNRPKIVIPPEAWPSASDGEPDAKAA